MPNKVAHRRRRRRHLHRRGGVRRGDRRAPARQDADHAAAAGHRHRERRRQGRLALRGGASCSCTAPRSRSTPSWSAAARRCALLTTQGFRDIYEIGRVNRPESYNLFFKKHAPLIDRDLRFEIMERMDSQGAVLIPLDEEQVRASARNAVAAGRAGDRHPVPALLPQSGARAAREGDRRAANSRTLFVTARTSCRQEYREYERTSTAAANAYVGPRVQRYLTEMEAHLETPDSAAIS